MYFQGATVACWKNENQELLNWIFEKNAENRPTLRDQYCSLNSTTLYGIFGTCGTHYIVPHFVALKRGIESAIKMCQNEVYMKTLELFK